MKKKWIGKKDDLEVGVNTSSLPTVPQSPLCYTPDPHFPNRPSFYAEIWIINVITSTCAVPAMTCKMSTGKLPVNDKVQVYIMYDNLSLLLASQFIYAIIKLP